MTKQIEQPQTCENTDTKLWSEPPKDYYSSSIHVTKNNKIGIDVGGNVFVKSLSEWHNLAYEALAKTQEPMTHVIGLDNDGKEVVVKLQTPLYTTPPSREWIGLSDEEITAIINEHTIKAIENLLKEKNNGLDVG